MQFVNPKNDVAFKKIFGNEQQTEILISFLNAVLDLTGEHAIQEIEILNPYQAPSIDSLKYTLLNVRARDKRGITFIVKIELEYVADFAERLLSCVAPTSTSQIDQGEDYPRLNQVIFIGILDFAAFEGTEYLTRHLILNTSNGKQEIRDLELNFIELPKFTRSEDQLESILEKWIYFIKHAGDLEVIPDNVDAPPLRAAYEAANRFRWSKADLETYENRGIKIQDERGMIQAAEARGEARGELKGLQKAAQAMAARGIDPAMIEEITGLSPTEPE